MFYSMDSLDAPPGPPSMTGVLYFNPKDVTALWAHRKDRRRSNGSFRRCPMECSSLRSAIAMATY
jgi:hypothetical protein